MLFGIDFSIKSPAVCLRNINGSINFLSFPRTDVIKEDVELALNRCKVIVIKIPKEPSLLKSSSLTERERSSLNDCSNEINIILRELDHLINDKISAWAIEGFSFASTGNRLAQLSGYQWVFRNVILQHFNLNANHMWVFAPMTVKATAGKGNFKKEDMIEAFLNVEDSGLRETLLWQKMKNEPSLFQNKKGAWLKPIDDIIDSYWVLRTLERHV